MTSSNSLQLIGWFIFCGVLFHWFFFAMRGLSFSSSLPWVSAHSGLRIPKKLIWTFSKMLVISHLLESQCLTKPQAIMWGDYGPRDLYRLQMAKWKMRAFLVFKSRIIVGLLCYFNTAWPIVTDAVAESIPGIQSQLDCPSLTWLLTLQTAEHYVIQHTTTLCISL